MTVESTIDYEALAQEAMRGVVRSVLTRAAKSGLPGDHHFYISFETEAPGVSLSKRLKEKYPREMTIVLQHRFWDLAVSEDRFEVKLTFDGIPERLVIPFTAVKVFFDPSVRFGLQFDDPNAGSETRAQAPGTYDGLTQRTNGARNSSPRKASRPTRKPRVVETEGARETPAAPQAGSAPLAPPRSPPSALPSGSAKPAPATSGEAPSGSGGEPEGGEPAKPPAGAEIVSLDKFRKK